MSSAYLKPPTADLGEQNTKMVDCLSGRGQKAGFADRREHPRSPKAGAVGRATIPVLRIDHRGRDYDCGAHHVENRQQMACPEADAIARGNLGQDEDQSCS